MNHHGRIPNAPDRSGWIIVSPTRHVTHVFELTSGERESLFAMIADVDRALTQLYGSRRTMVASLGWFVEDHLHFHCVPTFGELETRGYLNFGDAYVPVSDSIEEVVVKVREALRDDPTS